jgi:hypothetical protein
VRRVQFTSNRRASQNLDSGWLTTTRRFKYDFGSHSQMKVLFEKDPQIALLVQIQAAQPGCALATSDCERSGGFNAARTLQFRVLRRPSKRHPVRIFLGAEAYYEDLHGRPLEESDPDRL